MVSSRWERFAPLSGLVFVVLAIAGFVLVQMNSPEDFPGKVDEIVSYYQDESGSIMLGSYLGMLSVFFLLWFVGTLHSRMRRAEGGEGRVASILLVGGGAAAAISLAFDAVNAAAAFRADEDDAIAPETATALFDLSGALFGIAYPMALGVLVAATAVLALRVGALPRWFGIVSVVVALGLVSGFVAWLFAMFSVIWFAALSLILFRAEGGAEAATPAEPPATAAPA
jgi:hypothetical protein